MVAPSHKWELFVNVAATEFILHCLANDTCGFELTDFDFFFVTHPYQMTKKHKHLSIQKTPQYKI